MNDVERGGLGAELSSRVGAILGAADADIAARGPVCRASGSCCRFGEWGHRLYVTGAELMHFARHYGLRGARSDGNALRMRSTEAVNEGTAIVRVPLEQYPGVEEVGGCPYQVKGLCTVREARPLGCRVYFCDENAQGWQSEVYERYHAELRAVHEQFGVPYRYLEWRAGLRELTGEEGDLLNIETRC